MGKLTNAMRRQRHLLLVTTPAVLVAFGAAAAPPDLSLAGGPVSGGAHNLTLIAEEPTFEWPIVLRRNDNGAQARICIDVTPLIGPSARPVGTQRLSIDGQTGGNCVDMAGVDKTVVVRLSGALPTEGDFKGQIGLVVDNTQRTPYDVTVTRRKPATPPTMGIVGVGTDGKLAMTSDRAAVEWPITLRRNDAQPGDIEVRLQVGPLAGPSGTVVQPTLQRGDAPLTAPLKLPPLGQETLKLVASAPLEGSYAGDITYEVAGTRTPVTLALTRTHPDFDLKVEAIPKLRGTVFGDSVSVPLRLQNTTSLDRKIYLPKLARLDRLDGSGSATAEVGAAAYKVSYALPDGTAATEPVSIPADGSLDLRLSIKDLDEPGNYKGAMRFTATDRKPLDVAFELALRLGWIWAAVAILLGVLAAAFLREYNQQGRPRLLLQRQAIDLRTSLQGLAQSEGGNLSADERKVIVFLVNELDQASDQLADTDTPIETPTARIEAVRRKLPLLTPWIAARRQLDSAQPASVAVALAPTLEAARTVLLDPAATEQQVTTTKTALDGFAASVERELRRLVLAAAERLRTTIRGLDAAARAEFQPVIAQLEAVGTQDAPQPIALATKALDRARVLYAQIASGQLRHRLNPAINPVGFTVAAEWTEFVAEIRRMLDAVDGERDPERKIELWNDANRRYLVEVVKRAKARIDALVQANSVPAARPTLQGAAKLLADAQVALADDNLSAASVAYAQAMAEAEKARPEVEKAGSSMGAAGGATASAPASAGDVPSSIASAAFSAIVPLPLGRGATLAEVNNRLRNLAIILTAIVLVFAVVSGLQVLYMPNAAFGWWDVAVAFLWGAGLHAVAGQTFQGLQAFAQQLR